MSRILVTGGAGFLGSHLVDRLLKHDWDVIVLDNLYTGRFENLEKHTNSKKFKFINHDVTHPIDLDVDFIVNLACPASPIQYQKFPVETIRANVIGVFNMAELARRKKIPILQASTSEIYGDPLVSPQTETYWGNVNPIGVRACYDEGKRVAETILSDYSREYGLSVILPRIFNTYGPRMQLDDGRVVTNFIVQAIRNQDISIYGDGLQTRSFCFVDDLIDAFMLMIERYAEIETPINLGNPNEITMIELATQIITLTNSKSSIIFERLPSDDPKMRRPDISLAKKILGWEPKITLQDGLESTIKHIIQRLDLEVSGD